MDIGIRGNPGRPGFFLFPVQVLFSSRRFCSETQHKINRGIPIKHFEPKPVLWMDSLACPVMVNPSRPVQISTPG
jgi:hypothetical protein